MAPRVAWLGLKLRIHWADSADGLPLLRLGQMTRPELRGMEGCDSLTHEAALPG